jgi:hypothetical protein
MSTRQARRAVNRQRNEAAMLRRAVNRWLTTGTVPVAHIVADLDELEDAPVVLAPAPVLLMPNAAHAALA